MTDVGPFSCSHPERVHRRLTAYRKTISPLYGDVCRYYPSCSHYTLQAIQQHGAVKGIGLGAWRLLRCNPFSKGGVDDVPAREAADQYILTSFGFVTTQTRRGLTWTSSPSSTPCSGRSSG